jgi:hypothetical protein
MENLIHDMSNQNFRLKTQIQNMEQKSELMQQQLAIQEQSINCKENKGSLISQEDPRK